MEAKVPGYAFLNCSPSYFTEAGAICFVYTSCLYSKPTGFAFLSPAFVGSVVHHNTNPIESHFPCNCPALHTVCSPQKALSPLTTTTLHSLISICSTSVLFPYVLSSSNISLTGTCIPSFPFTLSHVPFFILSLPSSYSLSNTSHSPPPLQ